MSVIVEEPDDKKNTVVHKKFAMADFVTCIDNKSPLMLKNGFVRNIKPGFSRVLFKDGVLVWLSNDVLILCEK